MSMDKLPQCLALSTEEDFEFISQFIINSGSLKEIAKYYNVSYPTIRLRLDKLIQKVSSSSPENDDFINLIKQLALDGEMTYEAAKKLISSYKEDRG